MSRSARLLLGGLALSLSVALVAPADLEADTFGYFSYLHSIVFDRDLVLANEYAIFGVKGPGLTEAGVSHSFYAIGPAVSWLPFYLGTHAVLTVAKPLVELPWPADGLSAPYQYAARWGTAFWFLFGAYFLHREMAGRFPRNAARLGLAGAIVATPSLYYVTVGLTMAHGLAAAWACLSFAGGLAALRSGRARDWAWCGAALGLLMMARWQAFAFALFPMLVALARIFRDRKELRSAAIGAFAGLAAFLPQMIIWKLQYGVWVWIPRQYGPRAHLSWFDLSTAHWQDILWSSNKGLFVWTPLTFFCLVGLIMALRRAPVVSIGGGLVFVATVILSSATPDWHGSDAFGSRKFDLMLPFFAWGLARLSESLLKRPALVVGLGVASFGLWNVGMIRLKSEGRLDGSPSVAQIATGQVGLASGDARGLLTWALGPRGTENWYRLFVGDYIYVTSNPSGTLRLADPDSPYLALGFSEAVNGEGAPRWRWAAPTACVKFPIERSREPLRASVRLRNAPGIASQRFEIQLNDVTVGAAESGPDWSEPAFFLPPSAQVTGMNRVCFRFYDSVNVDGVPRSAAISVVRLP